MILVSIIEDNKNIQALLKNIVASDNRLNCHSVFANAESALAEMPESPPDIALVDIGLPNMNGIELVNKLKPKCPNTEFMMCTIYDEDEKVFQALEVGANSYILKSETSSTIIAAIIELNEGGSPMSSDIARKVVQNFRRKTDVKTQYGITKREEEILILLSKGLVYKEVADQLNISTKTIKKHIYNIYEKMQVHSKVEAVNKFLR